MNLTKLFHPYFEKDEGSGDGQADDSTDDEEHPQDAGKKKKAEISFTPEQQAFIDKKIGEARTKEREKAKADAEAKVKADQQEAERKALEEQGKHKELAEAAQKKADAEKARADAAEAELKKLRLQRKFEETIADLGLRFVNPKASEDAFAHLDLEAVGEEYAGLEAEVKRLAEDRSYYFEEDEGDIDIDATDKGKASRTVTKKEIVNQKKRSGRYTGV
jgi:colicin import membrane protein